MPRYLDPAWLGPHGQYLLQRRERLRPYLERKIPLFGLRYGTKIPLAKWRDRALAGQQDDLALTYDTNVAAVCGEVSQINVLDIEAPHVERFLAYCDRTGIRSLIEQVPRVRTWSGGYHYYVKHFPGQQTRDLWEAGVKLGQIKAGATDERNRVLASYVLIDPSVVVKDDRSGQYVTEVSLRDGCWIDHPPEIRALIGKEKVEDNQKDDTEADPRPITAHDVLLPQGLYGWPVAAKATDLAARMQTGIVDFVTQPLQAASDRSTILYVAIREAIAVGTTYEALVEFLEQDVPAYQKVVDQATNGDTGYLNRTISNAIRAHEREVSIPVTVESCWTYSRTSTNRRRLGIGMVDAVGKNYHVSLDVFGADNQATPEWEQLCAALWKYPLTRLLATNLRQRPSTTLLPRSTRLRVIAAPNTGLEWNSFRVIRFVPL